jgi:hypothetical protein
MMESSYWFEEASKYKEQARASEDPAEQHEFLELAEICIDFASRVEERATGG